MDYINNKGEKIGSLDTAISNDKIVTINLLNDVTTVTIRDRNTGEVTSETFYGDSPFGKVGCSPETNAARIRRTVLSHTGVTTDVSIIAQTPNSQPSTMHIALRGLP